ncbi:type VII secretion protein EccCa [Streptomyces oceani]|uniref:Cell division protein FtsK n=1 Tax=Streptomyces oceani TaxID=1075402 RepID=A0A1E7KHQ2_9ACTN|nr:type VII secretion protein EccCa [Streptomyces oceani]OEV03423.1 cell division protein FtsK [Streptomyces oceani]
MSTRIVHRPARSTRPLPDPSERVMEAPPNLPEKERGSFATSLLPMMGVMASVIMMTVVRNSQFAAIGAIVLVVAVVGGLFMLFSQRGKAQRTRRAQRESYLEYLEELREELSAENRERRAAARVLAPPPEALYDLVNDPARLWERRRTDRDFLDVRIGTGHRPVRHLTMPERGGSVLTPADPFMLNEAAGLQDRFAAVPEAPLTVPLDRVGNVSVLGPRESVLAVARTLAIQAAVSHAPDDLAFALTAPESRIPDWEWAKWLPHIQDSRELDGPVSARRIVPDRAQLNTALGGELRERAAYAAEVRRGLANRDALRLAKRLLVLSDGYGAAAEEPARPDEAVSLTDMGVTVLHMLSRQIDEPDQVSLRITVDEDGRDVTIEDLRGTEPAVMRGTLDEVTMSGAAGLARALAPLRLSAESAAAGVPLSGPVDFTELMGVDDPSALDTRKLWAPRGQQSFLRVPVGLGDSREPVLLDLKESAELGMGPHGLCVGATGSGKSELLRTLVLALVTTHPPEDLAMVLVDYKGGATFAPFAPLPHVAGIVTNLENRAGLVERVHASLAGEVQRRQQVLKDAGDIADISSYAAARVERPELEPLPHLFVVIDEFGELLTAKPDFIDLFLSIGRIGRSIGVHLLLSSQRIEGGRLKGLDTYLSYRLGLRTFSPEESRTVLDTPDAYHLPPIPGFGYLKVDTSAYDRFKASYVSGPYRGPVRPEVDGEDGPSVHPYPAYNTLAPDAEAGAGDFEPAPASRTVGPTLLSTMVGQLADAAPPVTQIWLPPLPELLTLDAVAGPIEVTADGMRLAARPAGPMRVPLGLLDDPARQWQGQWLLDLTVAGGHVTVIGGPQSGKTTLLRTMVLSLALMHTPRDVGVYGLDLVGGGLQMLGRLPHVGGVAGRTDRERLSRTVEEVRAMLAEREELFRTEGIDSVEELRRLRAAGRLTPDQERRVGSTDVVLVIDGYGALREEFEELDEAVTDVLKRGGGYGVHVVAAMLRWNDVRIAAQSAFGTRVELRLNDPSDSSVSRRLAETIRADEPGRTLTDGKLFAQTALPRIDGLASAEEPGAAAEQAVDAIRSQWSGPAAPPVRVLPARLSPRRLPTVRSERTRLPIGLDQSALEPVLLDLFQHDQHLVVLGDSECGKTNLLRLIARGLMARHSADDLVFAVLDPRRGLHSLVPEEYRGGYAHNAQLALRLSAGIATELDKRMPDETVPPEVLAAGGAAPTGPRIVVLVDDYDVLATAGQQPLEPFVRYLPSAPDIGLHFVVTRRAAGASRALYEPFLMTLRESGTAGLVMAGERAEGQVFPGVYPARQPPGRGALIRRGEPQRLIQTALAEDEDDEDG